MVQLEIRASSLADDPHSRRDAKAGVVDLQDPGFVGLHTDDSVVANTATESGRIDDRVTVHREIRSVHVTVVQADEDGLCPNPSVPCATIDGRETMERMRYSVIPEPGSKRVSTERNRQQARQTHQRMPRRLC